MVSMKGEMQDTAWLDHIEIVGGHPAVDFVNTVHSWVDPVLRDYLQTPAHLIGWCLHMGLIGAADARRLMRLAPKEGNRLLEEARALREAIYGVLSARLDGRQNDAALALLNRTLEKTARWRRLEDEKDGFAWRHRVKAGRSRSLLSPIAFAAAELLTSPELARLKACSPPEGCGWLFLDRSRNASRTWCSMKTCGNVAKLRRYRARQSRRKNAAPALNT